MTHTGRRPAPGTYDDLPAGLSPAEVALFERAEPYLLTRHNDTHIRTSLQFALELLEQEGGDRATVIPAVLLHDVGWHDVPEDLRLLAYGPNSSDPELNRHHEVTGAARAREILESLDYPPALVQEIVRIIETHDSAREARTLEEAVVKDADKFWRVCRLGFRINLADFQTITAQDLHDFVAVRAERWWLTSAGLRMARIELAARRREHGLDPAPAGPAPAGDGIGDMGAAGDR